MFYDEVSMRLGSENVYLFFLGTLDFENVVDKYFFFMSRLVMHKLCEGKELAAMVGDDIDTIGYACGNLKASKI